MESCQEARRTTNISFSEYVAALQKQATIYDGSHTTGCRSTPSSVNMHSFESMYDIPKDDLRFKSNIHTFDDDHDPQGFDNNCDQLRVNQTDTRNRSNIPCKVMMNRETWKSLPPNDQIARDCISDKGKESILTYTKNQAKNFNAKAESKNSPLYLSTFTIFNLMMTMTQKMIRTLKSRLLKSIIPRMTPKTLQRNLITISLFIKSYLNPERNYTHLVPNRHLPPRKSTPTTMV